MTDGGFFKGMKPANSLESSGSFEDKVLFNAAGQAIFQAFNREIPVGLSKCSLVELAEFISGEKKMDFCEVLHELERRQTEASTALNERNEKQRRRDGLHRYAS